MDSQSGAARSLPQIKGIAAGRKGVVDARLMTGCRRWRSFRASAQATKASMRRVRRSAASSSPTRRACMSDEVADLAMGLLIASARRLTEAERFLRENRWGRQSTFPLSSTLRGRHVGIVGLGHIGKAIATRCLAFGMSVSYHGRRRQPDVPYVFHERLLDLAAAVDVLMIAAPGGRETLHMVDAPCCRPGPCGHRGQRGARLDHRRGGPCHGAAGAPHPRRGAGRVRARTRFPARTARHGVGGADAARRVLLDLHP